MRLAFAVVLLVQLLWLRSEVRLFYSTESPSPPLASIAALYAPGIVSVAFWLWFASSALLLLGLFTRSAAIGCFLGCLYFIVLRQPTATHAADWLIPSMAFQVALLPSNRFLALDRRFFAALPRRDVPAWPLRLAQLSVAFFYFTAGTSKLGDVAWRGGKGFYMTFANPLLSHYDLGWLATHPALSPALNYGVMVWECAMPLLLLLRRTRLFAVISASVFLIAIDLDLPVGWFSWFCIANLFAFADDLAWPGVVTRRWPWLVPPSSAAFPVNQGVSIRGWRARAVSAFLAFHLASFAWMQLAYGYLARGRYDVGLRLAALPVLGTYGYGIASVRYYALWPSLAFWPLRVTYLEITPQGGTAKPQPPLDEQGRAEVGWLESRNVREGVMLARGLSDNGWRRYFAVVRERYADQTGKCAEHIQAFQVTVAPGAHDRDLRNERAPLHEARFRDCSPIR